MLFRHVSYFRKLSLTQDTKVTVVVVMECKPASVTSVYELVFYFILQGQQSIVKYIDIRVEVFENDSFHLFHIKLIS